MSKEVRSQKLDSIARCLERLESKRPFALDRLTQDVDLQDIVMINLERLVQLCVDVGSIVIAEKGWYPMPDSMATVFEKLRQEAVISNDLADRMKKSVGFRNLAVHEYDKINWSIVYSILSLHLDDFRSFAQKMDAI